MTEINDLRTKLEESILLVDVVISEIKELKLNGTLPPSQVEKQLRNTLLLMAASEIKLRSTLEWFESGLGGMFGTPNKIWHEDLLELAPSRIVKALSVPPTKLAKAINDMRKALNHYTPMGADCDCHLCVAKEVYDRELKGDL